MKARRSMSGLPDLSSDKKLRQQNMKLTEGQTLFANLQNSIDARLVRLEDKYDNFLQKNGLFFLPSFDNLRTLVFWFIWVAVGTAFYAVRNEVGFAKGINYIYKNTFSYNYANSNILPLSSIISNHLFQGLYMAVSIGYSIGWGYPAEKDDACIWFSIFYLMSGACAVTAVLISTVTSSVAANKSWFTQRLTEAKASHSSDMLTRLFSFYSMNKFAVNIISLWLGYIIAVGVYAKVGLGYSDTKALYFSVSTLSTVGVCVLPAEAEDWHFILNSFFAG